MSSKLMMDLLKGLQHPCFFGTYVFKYLNTGEITLEECFTNAYVEEVYESEHVHSATKQLRVILDAKYKIAGLHKVM